MLLGIALVCGALACGKYGPPVRRAPEPPAQNEEARP